VCTGEIDANCRTDMVKDRQDVMNQLVDTRNKAASKDAEKYWKSNCCSWSGGYYGGTTAVAPSTAARCSVHC